MAAIALPKNADTWEPRTCTGSDLFHEKCKLKHVNKNDNIRSDGKSDGFFHSNQFYTRITAVNERNIRAETMLYIDGKPKFERRYFRVSRDQFFAPKP